MSETNETIERAECAGGEESPPDQKTLIPYVLSPYEVQLWRNGLHDYQDREYGKAMDVFVELLSSNGLEEDYGLKHNALVSRFCRDKCLEHEKFREEFSRLFEHMTSESLLVKTEDSPYPESYYNQALLNFHDRNPWRAHQVLSSISKHSRVTNSSSFGNRVKLLKIEIEISIQNYESVLEIIETSSTGDLTESKLSNANESACFQDAFYDAKSGAMRLQEYKSLALLAAHNLRKGRKESRILRKACSTDSSGQLTVISHFLKAYHSYLSGCIKNGLSIISEIINPNNNNLFFETGDNLSMIINNNTGCCQFSLGKPTIAAWYFQKASEESNRPEYKNKKVLPLHCINFSKKYELMYNFGVALLHAKQPLEAFNVLSLCQNVFPTNPRLWLRIAECCVHLYKPSNDTDFVWSEEKRKILSGVQPEASCPKFDSLSAKEIDFDKPVPTLLYGFHCINTARTLVNSHAVQNSSYLEVKPSNPITTSAEINLLRANIYCTGSYIALTLQDFDEAFKLANTLYTMDGVPNVFQYLGRMYLGQALIKLGQAEVGPNYFMEVAIHTYRLNLTNPSSSYYYESIGTNDSSDEESSVTGQCTPKSNTSSPSNSVGFKPAFEWAPNDELTARQAMIYNEAVSLTMVGRYKEAAAIIDSWKFRMNRNGHSLPPDFVILQIHINHRLADSEHPTRPQQFIWLREDVRKGGSYLFTFYLNYF